VKKPELNAVGRRLDLLRGGVKTLGGRGDAVLLLLQAVEEEAAVLLRLHGDDQLLRIGLAEADSGLRQGLSGGSEDAPSDPSRRAHREFERLLPGQLARLPRRSERRRLGPHQARSCRQSIDRVLASAQGLGAPFRLRQLDVFRGRG
jgi:hypothetical protein